MQRSLQCKEISSALHMPSWATIWKWKTGDTDFSSRLSAEATVNSLATDLCLLRTSPFSFSLMAWVYPRTPGERLPELCCCCISLLCTWTLTAIDDGSMSREACSIFTRFKNPCHFERGTCSAVRSFPVTWLWRESRLKVKFPTSPSASDPVIKSVAKVELEFSTYLA